MSAPDGFGFLLLMIMVLPIWILCIGEIIGWLLARSNYLDWLPVHRIRPRDQENRTLTNKAGNRDDS